MWHLKLSFAATKLTIDFYYYCCIIHSRSGEAYQNMAKGNKSTTKIGTSETLLSGACSTSQRSSFLIKLMLFNPI